MIKPTLNIGYVPALLALTIALGACSSSGGNSKGSSSGSSTGGSTGSQDVGRIEGTVVDFSSCGAANVAGARVSAQGQSATSDALGHFVLEGLTAGPRVLVSVAPPALDAGSFSSTQLVVPVAVGQTTHASVELGTACHVSLPASTAVAHGASVDSSQCDVQGYAALILPPHALRLPDGSEPTTGDIDVALGVVPMPTYGSSSFDLSAFLTIPGDATALSDGGAQLLRSYGPAEVRLSLNGQALSIIQGSQVELRVALAAPTPGQPVAYAYNDVLGRWEARGAAHPSSALQMPAGYTPAAVYALTIDQLGWWNVEAPVNNPGCYHGVIVDASKGRAGEQLELTVNNAGIAVHPFTQDGGAFCVNGLAGSPAALAAPMFGTLFYADDSNTNHAIYAEAAASGSCEIAPSSCTDLGTLVVTPPVLSGCNQATLVARDPVRPDAGGSPISGDVLLNIGLALGDEQRKTGCQRTVTRPLTAGSDGKVCIDLPGHGVWNAVLSPQGYSSVNLPLDAGAAGIACGSSGCTDLGTLDFFLGS